MQVKEVCAVIEEHLGLCKGWLTATPCQVGSADCTATASICLLLEYALLSTSCCPESCAVMIIRHRQLIMTKHCQHAVGLNHVLV